MDKKTKHTNKKIHTYDTEMRDKLFTEILVFVFAIAIVNIVSNLVISFPFSANYKWVFVCLFVLVINKYKNKYEVIKFLFTTIIVLLILPLGWYQSGANNNNVIAYIFLIVIAVTFLFRRGQRLFLVITVALYFIIFLFIELKYDYLLPQYDITTQWFDRLFQIPIAIFGSYIMLRQFSNAYANNATELSILNMQLESIAYTDSLTQISNRAYIFRKFNEVIDDDKDFVTVIIDIDDFKYINDNYGHLVGDELLKDFGQLLKEHFEPHGYAARYGGDEFLLLLFLDIRTVRILMTNFIESFNELKKTKIHDATISAGYGAYNNTLLDEHLKEIDQALYEAKRTGKNKFLPVQDIAQ